MEGEARVGGHGGRSRHGIRGGQRGRKEIEGGGEMRYGRESERTKRQVEGGG